MLKKESNSELELTWPVTINELHETRDNFLNDMYEWILEQDIDKNKSAELIWLNIGSIAHEFMRIFNGYLVINRLSSNKNTFLESKFSNKLFVDISLNRQPDFQYKVRHMLTGLVYEKPIKKIGRLVKHNIFKQKLKYKPKVFINPKKDIVTFSSSPLIEEHASIKNKNVIISRIDEWFPTGMLNDNSSLLECNNEIVHVIKIIEKRFESAGVTLPSFITAHFQKYLELILGFTRNYMNKLYEHKKNLPSEFWSGTGGIIYNRIMSRVVSKNGGLSIGHDHGTGYGWWKTNIQTINELNYVDKFITFSKEQAEGQKKNINLKFLVHKNDKYSISPMHENDIYKNHINIIRHSRLPSKVIKKVMYVPTCYTRDETYFLPLLCDYAAIDWQTRLVEFLDNNDFEVFFKPHPDDRGPELFPYKDYNNVTIVQEPFEKVLDSVDLLIFDYLQTSCIVGAVKSNLPIVLIDFPRLVLEANAKSKLQKRCAFVEGWYDTNGHAQVDWDDLKNAISNSKQLHDNSFSQEYFPHII